MHVTAHRTQDLRVGLSLLTHTAVAFRILCQRPVFDLWCLQKPGYITFAKTGAPNSRTTQLFINYGDNARLDGMGFAPFGKVEGDGMEVMKRVFNW